MANDVTATPAAHEDSPPSSSHETAPPQVEAIVDRLLSPLTPEQQRIVDVTAHAYFTNDKRWPTFQHVQALLDRERLDAKTVLSTFPLSPGPLRYGAFTSLVWAGNISDDTELGLTLLGLFHYKGPFAGEVEALTRDVLRLLQLFIDVQHDFLPPPTKVEYLQISGDDARSGIARLRGGSQHALPEPRVFAYFVSKEPPSSPPSVVPVAQLAATTPGRSHERSSTMKGSALISEITCERSLRNTMCRHLRRDAPFRHRSPWARRWAISIPSGVWYMDPAPA
jgi:hypothetical protein